MLHSTISGSQAFTVTTATQLKVSTSSTATAGLAFTMTVTAENASNSTVTGYLGTVHFATSDTSGTDAIQTITFTGSPTGGTFGLIFAGQTASGISYSTYSATLGTNIQNALNGLAGIGNTAVSAISGTNVTVTFEGTLARAVQATMGVVNNLYGSGGQSLSIAPTQAGVGPLLPANYTFTSGNNGIYVFTSGVTLITAATETVSVTDTGNSAVSGNAAVTVSGGTATQLTITAPSTAAKSTAFTITVKALDAYGNIATGYVGDVHFTKTDNVGGTVAPADYTFLSGDHGVKIFTGGTTTGVTLVTSGSQTITATDATTGTITGSTALVVTDATHFSIYYGLLLLATAEQGWVVTALQASGSVATDYTGIVHFSSSDTTLAVSLPPDYQFTTANHGVYFITSGAGLITSGSQTLTVSDAGNSSISGSHAVTVGAGAATRLVVTGPATVTAGSSFSVTVTAHR